MSTTQSIIVYRNPLEQAVWESVMGLDLGGLFPIMVGAFAGIATVMIVSSLITRFNGSFNRNWLGRHGGNISLALGGIAWFVVAKMMWL